MKRIFVLFIIFVSHLSGCSSFDKVDLVNKTANSNLDNKNNSNSIANENFRIEWKSKYEATAVKLESSRKLWQENQILNYDFVIGKYAPGMKNDWNRLPVLIKVRDGVNKSIEKVEKDKDYVIYSRTDGFEDFDTIDKLFKYLSLQLEKGTMLNIKYNKKYGYPEFSTINFSYETHGHVNLGIEKIKIIKTN